MEAEPFQPLGLCIDKLTVETKDIVNSDFFMLLPVINVDKVKEIPCDYLGAMGVPLTIFGQHFDDRFQVLDMKGGLKIDGREIYKRIIIKDKIPDLPAHIDLAAYANSCGFQLALTLLPLEDANTHK